MTRQDYEIYETRMLVFKSAGWQCEYKDCESTDLQLAHCIAQTKANEKMIRRIVRETHGEEISKREAELILHHPRNLRASCAEHNSYFNCGNNPQKVKRIICDILGAVVS